MIHNLALLPLCLARYPDEILSKIPRYWGVFDRLGLMGAWTEMLKRQVRRVNGPREKGEGGPCMSKLYTTHQNTKTLDKQPNNLIFSGPALPIMCLPAMPTPGRWTCTTTIQNFRTLPFPRTLALPPLTTTPLVGCPPASTVCAPQGSAGSSAHPGISASEQIIGSFHLIGCNSLSHS